MKITLKTTGESDKKGYYKKITTTFEVSDEMLDGMYEIVVTGDTVECLRSDGFVKDLVHIPPVIDRTEEDYPEILLAGSDHIPVHYDGILIGSEQTINN